MLNRLLVIDDMEILLLLPLFSHSGRWQIVVTACSVILEVEVSQIFQVSRLDAEVLKGLCRAVDELVDGLLLTLVSTSNWPPNKLVKVVQERFHHSLWYVNVSSLMNDFPINQFTNFGHAVFLRTVELKRLSSCGVVVANLLKSSTNINCLGLSVRELEQEDWILRELAKIFPAYG